MTNNLNLIIEKDIDIYRYPTVSNRLPTSDDRLAIGDLHANTIKFIYFLIKENVIHLSEGNFDHLVSIYKKSPSYLTKTDIKNFNKIIRNINIIAKPTLKIIGDTLADRGANDYFILKIFEKLSNEQVLMDIHFSNHDLEFINFYENNLKKLDEINESLQVNVSLGKGQAQSLINLGILLKNGTLSQNDFQSIKIIVKNNYLPYLKLLSYEINEKGLIIYTHAPIHPNFFIYNLKNTVIILNEFIKEYQNDLAQCKNIIYSDISLHKLMQTIDATNKQFNLIAKAGHIESLMNKRNYNILNPFYAYTWARYDDYRPEIIESSGISYLEYLKMIKMLVNAKNFDISFVHGHDGNGNVPDNLKNLASITNLDNQLGKGQPTSISKSYYTIHQVKSSPLEKETKIER